MEHQTIGTGYSQLPPAFLIKEQPWSKTAGHGNLGSPVDTARPRTGDQIARADTPGIVASAAWRRVRPNRSDDLLLPDLDRAYINPATVFGSPHAVVSHPLLTLECKREILQRWAWDEYLLDLASAEGMPEGELSRLAEVKAALRLVSMERSPDPAAPAAFIVPYHWDEIARAA